MSYNQSVSDELQNCNGLNIQSVLISVCVLRHCDIINYMILRKQKGGFQKPWKLKEIAAGFEHFYKEHNRYPTATEIDWYPYLPASRSIERSLGGLVNVRKKLKLKGQEDFRSGEHSVKRAKKINKRAHEIEAKIYEFLCKSFQKEFVHREFFFTDDRRSRADFFVYDTCNGFCVDVFYPADRRNLTGCLNSKLQKYKSEYMSQYPIIFLQMNENISEKTIEDVLKNKKKTLAKGQYLMGWQIFQEFCGSRKSLKIQG